MPIKVLTGKPRNGKTLRMMWLLEREAKAATRPLYASGIDGLEPGLATVLADASQWNAFTVNPAGACHCFSSRRVDQNGKVLEHPRHDHIVPDGSLIFVDEAWKWFGHLHNAARQATPQHVLDMAEHGHRGLDFVFTTQGPGQLYPFLRTLIDEHTHCVRIMGAEACRLYEWPELNDDVKSASMREAAVSTFWKYPKALYAKYHSANVHTVKFKLNPRVALFVALVLAVIGLGYYGVTYFRDSSVATPLASADVPPGGQSASPSPQSSPVYAVPTQAERAAYLAGYVYAHTPRIPGQAWTAPVFDGRPVTAEPRTLCAASGLDGADGCHCYTEQATPIVGVDQDVCLLIARNGEPYNPYRARAQSMDGPVFAPPAPGGEGAPPSAMASQDAVRAPQAAIGTGTTAQMASYGGFRQ